MAYVILVIIIMLRSITSVFMDFSIFESFAPLKDDLILPYSGVVKKLVTFKFD